MGFMKSKENEELVTNSMPVETLIKIKTIFIEQQSHQEYQIN